MANSRVCEPCSKGVYKDCKGRFAAASNRTELTHGYSKPKRPLYSYKCPNLKVA